MRIKQVQQTIYRDSIKITAQCRIRRFGDDEIYFTIPKKYKSFIASDASAFAAALLLPSMKLGEDLIIDGSISKQLYENMIKIMDIFVAWNVGFKKIAIKAKKLTDDHEKGTYNASFFSAGVDSFYTYLKNKKSSHGPLTHLILVNGYDIELSNKKLWEDTRKHVKMIATKEHMDVIEVESNFQETLRSIIPWEYIFGACLGAIGLLLRKKLKLIYIPSSFKETQQFPGGSTIFTDKYWGTNTLTIIHDGAEASRVEKVKKIAKSKLVLDNLRVCFLNLADTYNCGKCDKCIRTMISLKIAGGLEKAKTFPHTITVEQVKNLKIDNIHVALFHEENLEELKKIKKDKQLQNAIRYCLKNMKEKKTPFGNLTTKAILYDYLYTRGILHKVYRKTKSKMRFTIHNTSFLNNIF